jgi:hydroxymethylpyrimidine pyrophosphatase-like HAD family hydrolase
LQAARARGLISVLVTARPPRRVRELAARAGSGGFAICSNGALIYDLERDQIVEQTATALDAARSVITSLRAALPGCVFRGRSRCPLWLRT